MDTIEITLTEQETSFLYSARRANSKLDALQHYVNLCALLDDRFKDPAISRQLILEYLERDYPTSENGDSARIKMIETFFILPRSDIPEELRRELISKI